MNSELINRLALEAGEYTNSVYTPPVRSKTLGILWEPGHFAWHAIFQEKFAELIVRECARICEANVESYKYSFTPAKALLAGSTSVYCGTLIKLYFGVEE
jgi:hypothetical protein